MKIVTIQRRKKENNFQFNLTAGEEKKLMFCGEWEGKGGTERTSLNIFPIPNPSSPHPSPSN